MVAVMPMRFLMRVERARAAAVWSVRPGAASTWTVSSSSRFGRVRTQT